MAGLYDGGGDFERKETQGATTRQRTVNRMQEQKCKFEYTVNTN